MGVHVPVYSQIPRTIEIVGEDGKKAVVDYSGDAVSYSGELEVEESARLFFEAIKPFVKEAFAQERKNAK